LPLSSRTRRGRGSEGTVATAAVRHFAVVFGAGFLFALVRIPWLEPRIGARPAELVEMPLMLLVILWSSRRVARRWTDGRRSTRLAAGLLALALLLTAELGLAYALEGLGPLAYVAGRDPVSGTVYALCLALFALAPAFGAPVTGAANDSGPGDRAASDR